MSFASFPFLALLAISVPLFWLVPWQRARLVVALVASVVFYAFRHWPSVGLLAASVGFNFAMGLVLERRKSRALLAVAVGVNLLGLSFFKYARFLVSVVSDVVVALGGTAFESPATPAWLPLGISFFTFQVIAYLVDVFRGQLPAERDLLVFAVFKSFLGQLIAGPIVKGKVLFPQLRALAPFDASLMHRGVWLIGIGLFLKVGVADVIGPFVDHAYLRVNELAVNEAWLAAVGYSAQLFADFWGYSTVAVGVGLLFGLQLPFNFETPYRAASLQQFWRRWHITLSNWFRDYLYVPLGGNQRHVAVNLLITMTLAGLWHGAGWTFVVWGALHGLWLVAERSVSLPLPKWLKTALVFLGVTWLWVPFRAPSMTVAVAMWRAMVWPPYRWQIAIPPEWPLWVAALLVVQSWLDSVLREGQAERWPVPRQVALAGLLTWLVLAYGGAPRDFVYFVF